MTPHEGAELPDGTDFSSRLRKPVSLASWSPIIAHKFTSILPAATNPAPDSLVSLRDNILANDRIKNTGAAQFHLVQPLQGGLQDFEENKTDFADGVEDDRD